MEAYRIYTPSDPEARENQSAINMASVNQAASNICRKLQHLDGFVGKQLTESVAVAEKVFQQSSDP